MTWFRMPGSETGSGAVGATGVGYVGFSFESGEGTRYGWLRIESREAVVPNTYLHSRDTLFLPGIKSTGNNIGGIPDPS